MADVGQGREDTSQLAVAGQHRKGADCAPGANARRLVSDADGPLNHRLPGSQRLHFWAVVEAQRPAILIFPGARRVAQDGVGSGIAQVHGAIFGEDEQADIQRIEQRGIVANLGIIGTQIHWRRSV